MSPAERRAWAKDLRDAADRLQFAATAQTVHRLAQVRCHLLLVADLLESDADSPDDRKIGFEVVNAVASFLLELGRALEDGVIDDDERIRLRSAWEPLRAVVSGVLGPKG